jgi:hypothetical protein
MLGLALTLFGMLTIFAAIGFLFYRFGSWLFGKR